MQRILYAKPSITDAEVRAVHQAVSTGWGPDCYADLVRFEAEFAAYLGARHGLATSSATGALHLALAALGVGPGDEVIIADTNWIASVAPVCHLGATPVFVDILPDTWCLDPDRVEAAVTPRTRAIIAVHLYGNLCDMDRLEDIARRHGLWLVEDAAEALGSCWGTVHAGARGIVGVFSFHGTKVMTTGEGGMLVTSDADLYARASMLANHGRQPGDARQFWASALGFKYKMSNIQAALGRAQLARLPELLRRKREIFKTYARLLAAPRGAGLITMNPEPAGTTNSYWMPTVVFAPETGVTQAAVLERFARADIDGRSFFHPLSGQADFTPGHGNANSYSIAGRAVNLPSYHDMTDADMGRVAGVILDLCAGD